MNQKVIVEVDRQDVPRIAQFVGTWEAQAVDEVRADLEGCGGEWPARSRWEIDAEYDGGDPSVGLPEVGHVLNFDSARPLPLLPEDAGDWQAAGGEAIAQVLPVLQDVCARSVNAKALLTEARVFDFHVWRVLKRAPGTVRTTWAYDLADQAGEAPIFVVISATEAHPQALPHVGGYRLEILSNEHGCELLDLQVKDGALTVLVEDL